MKSWKRIRLLRERERFGGYIYREEYERGEFAINKVYHLEELCVHSLAQAT